MDIRDEIGSALKTVSLVAVSTLVSLVVYLAIAEFIRARLRPFQGFAAVGNVQQLRFLFFGGAIVAVLTIRVIRQVLLRGRTAGSVGEELRRLQRTSLVTIVLAEVPAVLGLILFLIAGRNVDFYLLLLVSIVLLFMYFPRQPAWEDWLRGR
jgi:hypothetical protein